MQSKSVKKSAHRGSKRVKGISREVRVTNLQKEFGIDQQVLCTLMVIASPHRHHDLFYKVYNALLGFDVHVQSQMKEDIAQYYTGEAYTITGLQHVDAVLVNLYREIDRVLLNP